MKLIDAESKYLEEYKKAYIMALECVQKGIIKKHDLMFMDPEETDIVKTFMDNRDQSKLPSYYVPSYDYFAINDEDELVGVVHIRTSLTDSLLRYGGHIGYGVCPSQFKKGYGTEILKLALLKAKDLVKEDNILITCDDDNIGSYKIIEANGGNLENKVENEDQGEKFLTRRYWIKK